MKFRFPIVIIDEEGRDFDVLAQSLVARSGGTVRVVCPDVVRR